MEEYHITNISLCLHYKIKLSDLIHCYQKYQFLRPASPYYAWYANLQTWLSPSCKVVTMGQIWDPIKTQWDYGVDKPGSCQRQTQYDKHKHPPTHFNNKTELVPSFCNRTRQQSTYTLRIFVWIQYAHFKPHLDLWEAISIDWQAQNLFAEGLLTWDICNLKDPCII